MSESALSFPDLGYGAQISANRPDALDIEAVGIIEAFTARERGGRRPLVLDVGCGAGVHSVRMATAGANVLALDCQDFTQAFHAAATVAGLDDSNVKFIHADARDLLNGSALDGMKFDLVHCQRMLHYVRYDEAMRMLKQLCRQMSLEGKLCLGISGMSSELSIGYEHGERPIENRFCVLASSMRHKHGIFREVCLYKKEEAVSMVQSVAFEVSKAWCSEFGNVKLIAGKSR